MKWWQVVGRSGEEGSDIRQAEEDKGNLQGSPQLVVDVPNFLMAGFCFIFLDLVHLLLRFIYYNDFLVWYHGGRVPVRRQPHSLEGSGELPAPLVSQVLQQHIAAFQPTEESENKEETEEEEEVATLETAAEPTEEPEGAAAGESSAGATGLEVGKNKKKMKKEESVVHYF
ncbi:Cancer/Testis Antigen 47B [Manis pentadactyla]|nr:Cancer/Testis Antigen 47B [Manis pentadactyla]